MEHTEHRTRSGGGRESRMTPTTMGGSGRGGTTPTQNQNTPSQNHYSPSPHRSGMNPQPTLRQRYRNLELHVSAYNLHPSFTAHCPR